MVEKRMRGQEEQRLAERERILSILNKGDKSKEGQSGMDEREKKKKEIIEEHARRTGQYHALSKELEDQKAEVIHRLEELRGGKTSSRTKVSENMPEDAEILAERLNMRSKESDEISSLREKHRKELQMDRKMAADVMSELSLPSDRGQSDIGVEDLEHVYSRIGKKYDDAIEESYAAEISGMHALEAAIEMDAKKKSVPSERQGSISDGERPVHKETPRSEIASKDGESARNLGDKQIDALTFELEELKQLYKDTGESDPEILQQIEEIERELGNAPSSRGVAPHSEGQGVTKRPLSRGSGAESKSARTPADLPPGPMVSQPQQQYAPPVQPTLPPGGFPMMPQYPPFPQYPQHAFPYPSGLPDEMLEQIQQQLRQTDDLLRRHAHENEELEEKVEDLLTRDGMDKKRRKEAEMEKRIKQLQKKIDGDGKDDDGDGTDFTGDEPDELKKLKYQHMQEMAKLRYEMERLKQENELEKLRAELEESKKSQEKKREHEKWLEDQKRALVEARFRKQIALEQSKPDTADSAQSLDHVYKPEVGLALFWDFVAGLPKRAMQVFVAYGFFNKDEQKSAIRALPTMDCESDGARHNRSILAVKRKFVKMAASPHSRVVMEIQMVVKPAMGPRQPAKTHSLGWTAMPLFRENGNLMTGNWTIPVFWPPTSVQMTVDEMVQNAKRVPHMTLNIRIVHGDQLDAQSAIGINPDQCQMDYSIPGIFGSVKTVDPESADDDKEFDFDSKPKKPPLEKKKSMAAKKPEPKKEGKKEEPAPPKVEEEERGEVSPDMVDVKSEEEEKDKDEGEDEGEDEDVEGEPEKGGLDRKLQSFRTVSKEEEDMVIPDDQEQVIEMLVRRVTDSVVEELSKVRVWVFHDQRKMRGRDGSFFKWETRERETNDSKAVEFEETFDLRGFEPKEGMKILFEFVHVKPPLLEDDERDEKMVGWGLLDLYDESLNPMQGVFRIDLFKPPVMGMPVVPRLGRQQSRRQIKKPLDTQSLIPCEMAKSIVVKLDVVVKDKLPEDEGAIDGDDGIESSRSTFQEDGKTPRYVPKDVFCLTEKAPNVKPLEMPTGVDIYVDSARFLPDNVGMSRIFVSVRRRNRSYAYEETTTVADINSSTRSPAYAMKLEVRGSSFNGTETLLIRIEAIDKFSYLRGVVGYAAMNLFIDLGAREVRSDSQPTSATKNIAMNSGNFQIPLYRNGIKPGVVISEKGVTRGKRVYGASILVRIVEAPKENGKVLSRDNTPSEEWHTKGVIQLPPPYSSGVYDSSRCGVLEEEQNILLKKVAKRDEKVESVLEKMSRDPLPEDEEGKRQVLREIFPIESRKVNAPMDYSYLSEYDPKRGFLVSIDGCRNLSIRVGFIKCIASICPPGSFYGPERSTEHVIYTHENDMSSYIRSPSWKDGLVAITGVPYSKNAFLIVDVISMQGILDPFSAVSIGYSLIPIFAEANYVRSGAFQVPIIQGPVNRELLEEIKSSDLPAHEFLVKKMLSKTFNMSNNMSLFVRIVDVNRKSEFITLDMEDVATVYLPSKSSSKYAKQPKSRPQSSGIPPGVDPETFQQDLNAKFASEFGLH
eukprot:TRINITY_DN1588_c0_g1_i6.p1 TRINITY_DN1588_c0_g1~~TRINITY_DN1588_c0_g1_i6.p1  ORF type:complete len:1564 (+),score=502.49 TRINITY_DN1588_c0_g1_i6:351-5042(+)